MGPSPPEHQRLTIAAVAERAGVSMMTVSNVLNGKGRVGAATRDRVLGAVRELGYVPNQAARRLVGTEVASIGLIYPSVESVFIEMTLSAVAIVAAEQGVQLHIRSLDPAATDAVADVAAELTRKGVHAMLLLPPFAEQLGRDRSIDANAMPMAAIATADALPAITTIRIDNHAAAYAMTERLLESGYRRIAMLAGPSGHSDSVARLQGYRAALRAGRVSVDATLEAEGDFTFQSGLVGAERLLDLPTRPDAIVAANDDMAAAVLWLAHQRGIRLPQDLAVTGFDDTLIATRVWPALTTVRQPIRDMAATAIAWLAQAVRSPTPTAIADVVLPYQIINRRSA